MIRIGTLKDEGDGGGAGKAWAALGSLQLSYPLRGTVTGYFGMIDGVMNDGVDIQAKAGAAVAAPGEGVVVYCAQRGEYGFVVEIDHGNGFLSRLAHLDGVAVEMRQRVFSGDVIGAVAKPGDGSKPFLHYELHVGAIPVNPLLYID